ncbi:MAG: hypothetical protein PHF67_00750 [Candidatus Nanoarchaeia archaeon]|nr:hypothetical protein [Candidatus Nanoarchaeia archaeon]
MTKSKIRIVQSVEELDECARDRHFRGTIAVNYNRDPRLKIRLWAQINNPHNVYHVQDEHGNRFLTRKVFDYVLYGRAA